MILTIRTDKPEAYIGLINASGEPITEHTWQAHRELSNTLLLEIENLLASIESSYQEISSIAIYSGPGSFTGLRIGITVANTLADSLSVPIVGCEGESWLDECMQLLKKGEDRKIVMPEYGGEANITKPRK